MLKAGLGSTEGCKYLAATHAQAETQRAGAHLPFIKCNPARPVPGNGEDPSAHQPRTAGAACRI